MPPGTVVGFRSGPWVGRTGIVDAVDPEWVELPVGLVAVRLRDCRHTGEPYADRIIVRVDELEAVDLRRAA